jgi:hypothetical protein
VVRDSSVGTATSYRLEVRGSNPGGVRFSAPVQTGTPSLLYRVFPGGKAAGAWRRPTTPSSAEVKESVELYLYSPSGPSCPVLGWTLPLPFTFTVKHFPKLMWLEIKPNILVLEHSNKRNEDEGFFFVIFSNITPNKQPFYYHVSISRIITTTTYVSL